MNYQYIVTEDKIMKIKILLNITCMINSTKSCSYPRGNLSAVDTVAASTVGTLAQWQCVNSAVCDTTSPRT